MRGWGWHSAYVYYSSHHQYRVTLYLSPICSFPHPLHILTCLLVPLAISIMPRSNCRPFDLADRAFKVEHSAKTAFTFSVVTSSSSWCRCVSPRVMKSWYRSGARKRSSEMMLSRSNWRNPSREVGPCVTADAWQITSSA